METLLNYTARSQAMSLHENVGAIKRSRELHERLIESHDLPATEKVQLARQIAGLLFGLEAGQNIPTPLLQSLRRLRADAENRAGLSDAEGLRSPTEVWDHYERLESASA